MSADKRPLSPHLQVYRPQLTSITSIAHRITGIGLSAGTLLLVWWLVAASIGPDYFALVSGVMGSIIGQLIMFCFTFALMYHLCNGIRHLFWDAGYGFELETAYKSGYAVIIGAVALTIITWLMAI